MSLAADLALPPFAERFPWIGGDLQTLRSRLMPAPRPTPGVSTATIELQTSDGSGDVLLAEVDRPPTIEAAPVLLIHGLAGSARSRYMLTTARHLTALGHPVVRLNLRGAGPSAARCRYRYHAGRTDDLRDAIAGLPHEISTGLCAVGFSLGGNALLKLLGEEGGRSPIGAAISVSAPIDLDAACRCIDRGRNLLYREYVLAALRRDDAAATSVRVRSLREFDDRVTAPANGFRDAAEYYRSSSAYDRIGAIAVPTVLVHATNDPWVPAEPYRRLTPGPAVSVALVDGGGHVGFHGRGSGVPWHDRASALLFGVRPASARHG